ncbi:CRAL-TRIO domain-containing protein, partial [Cynara cardunculus var. scolymus]
MEEESPSESFHDTVDEETFKKNEEQEGSIATELNKKKRKALSDLRSRLEESILDFSLIGEQYKACENLKDVELWGVPLLPSRGSDKTDIVLKKFLKAKDYNVQNALEMLGNTIMWREDFNVDKVFDEMFGSDLDDIGYIEGTDKVGHPLCYQMYESIKERDILRRLRSNDFLRWRIKLMEGCVRKLDFKPDGADSVIQIIDVKDISRPFLNEIFQGSKKYFSILQDNYPGIIYRFYKVMYVKPSAITETLLKFIDPEHLLAQYGGLGMKDGEFSLNDQVLEEKLKGYATEHLTIVTPEVGMTVYWDVTVTGSDVSYKEEFVPDDEGSYNVLVQKGKQIGRLNSNSFHVAEPGKILITFVNYTSKNRRIFYRYKIKPTLPILPFSR